MIEFQHVSKTYPCGHEALLDISFTIQQGEMVFLTGHSGAGKSTLLKLITMIEHPTRGRINLKKAVERNPVAQRATSCF